MAGDAWMGEWNNIVRHIIYPDEELKTLMLVPEGTDIITFLDKYFIRAGYTDELLKNEKVRVVYDMLTEADTRTPNVKMNILTFDIFVKDDQKRNATNDRLQSRGELIALHLNKLLTKTHHVKDTGYRFNVRTEGDLGTRTIGYGRYHISFNYMRVY